MTGGFDGGGRAAGAGSWLLTYATLMRRHTVLPPGERSVSLLVFYDASVDPGSFKALLNGVDVSGRFVPTPRKGELARIGLARGTNTLLLSTSGTTPEGLHTSERDRLVFVAR